MTDAWKFETKLARRVLNKLADAALGVGDAWMAERLAKTAARQNLRPFEAMTAVGEFLRLLEPSAEASKKALVAAAKGDLPEFAVAGRAAAQSFDAADLKFADDIVMSQVEMMMRETDQETFTGDRADMAMLAAMREKTEALRAVLRLNDLGRTSRLAVRGFDEEMLERFAGGLPSREDADAEETLRRAAGVDPQAWWTGGGGFGAF